MNRLWILVAFSVVLGCGLLSDLTGTRCNPDGFCGDGLVCLEGRCESSCGALTDCGGYCADLQQDPKNCGICGIVCSEGWSCSAGACVPGAEPDGGVDAGSGDGGVDAGTSDGGSADAGEDEPIDPEQKPLVDSLGWFWEHPAVPVADFYAMHAFGREHIWVVGEMGFAMRWNGKYWTSHPIENELGDKLQAVRAIHGISPDVVWAVGDHGLVLEWVDGKWMTSWPFKDDAEKGNLHAVWVISENHVLALGVHGRVVRWDGSNWDSLGGASTPETFEALWGDGKGSVYAIGENGRVGRYTYDPQAPDSTAQANWMPDFDELKSGLVAITGFEDRIYVGGADGTVHQKRGDLPFEPMTLDFEDRIDSISALDVDDDGVLWIAYRSGKAELVRRNSRLEGEFQVRQTEDEDAIAVRAFGADSALAIGSRGLVSWWRSDGEEPSWRSEHPGGGFEITALAAGGDRAWALAKHFGDGVLLSRDPATGSWSERTRFVFHIEGIGTDPDGQVLWLVGGDAIYFSVDGGQTLSSADLPVEAGQQPQLNAVSSPMHGLAYVAGQGASGSGLVLECNVESSATDDVTCEAIPISSSQALTTIWAVDHRVVWAGGYGNSLLECTTTCEPAGPASVPDQVFEAIWVSSTEDSKWFLAHRPTGGWVAYHSSNDEFEEVPIPESKGPSRTHRPALTGTDSQAWGIDTSGRWGKLVADKWQSETTPYELNTIAVNDHDLFVAGNRGAILRRAR